MYVVEIAYKQYPQWIWEKHSFRTADEANDFIGSLNNMLPDNAEIFIRERR